MLEEHKALLTNQYSAAHNYKICLQIKWYAEADF